ncbi:hypothetical protein EDC04DRAFT_64512 [Pisolithus marmoratus]|nr:hypothetical protein EDC04DRAFT_64512 [Pisolithus marmoratus]
MLQLASRSSTTTSTQDKFMTTRPTDSAIRDVQVSSASFAGRPFTVTITFTNTHTPESWPRARNNGSNSTHKRCAHSISFAIDLRSCSQLMLPHLVVMICPRGSDLLSANSILVAVIITPKRERRDVLERRRRGVVEKPCSLSVDTLTPGLDPNSRSMSGRTTSSQTWPQVSFSQVSDGIITHKWPMSSYEYIRPSGHAQRYLVDMGTLMAISDYMLTRGLTRHKSAMCEVEQLRLECSRDKSSKKA